MLNLYIFYLLSRYDLYRDVITETGAAGRNHRLTEIHVHHDISNTDIQSTPYTKESISLKEIISQTD